MRTPPDTPSPGGFRFSSRLERRIVQRVGQAIGDHGLIEDGDHLLVAVSGGKDSLSMLEALRLLRRRSPVSFRMTVVTLHQGFESFSTNALEAFYRQTGLDYEVIHAPIKQILESKLQPGTTPCALCSRIRRGVLYSHAPRLGCNKIALGHHLDDIAETLLMNMFYSGQLRAMAPLRRSDDGRNTVIRPLCYVEERWLADYARQRALPVSVCATEGCGSEDGARVRTKKLIQQLDREIHGLRGNLLRALRNVRADELLDSRLARLVAGRPD